MATVKPNLVGRLKLHGNSRSHARTDISVRDVETTTDEPEQRGGTNMGLSPVETLMAALIGCTNVISHKIAARDGVLDKFTLRWHDAACVCVVMAAQGYPGVYDKGSVIGGLDAADALAGVTVFHAGTTAVDGDITATGGRVLGVTATAPTIAEAQARAYAAVDAIDWPQGFCRRDIGWRAVGKM